MNKIPFHWSTRAGVVAGILAPYIAPEEYWPRQRARERLVVEGRLDLMENVYLNQQYWTTPNQGRGPMGKERAT